MIAAYASAPQAVIALLTAAGCLAFYCWAVFSRTYQNRNNPR